MLFDWISGDNWISGDSRSEFWDYLMIYGTGAFCIILVFGIIFPILLGADCSHRALEGKILEHNTTENILTIGSTTVKVDYLPKLVDLTGTHVIIREAEKSNDRYKSRYKLQSDVRHVEVIPDLSAFTTVTGRIKITTNDEIAILLYNEELQPELSITGYFDKNIDISKHSAGDTIQFKGVIFAIKFDWIGINNTEIIPNDLEGNRGT